jgi:hypothetical protein
MKWASYFSTAILIAGLASLGLVPLEADSHGPLGSSSPLLKFANGSRIVQVYVQPSADKNVLLPANGPISVNLVQSACEKQYPLGDSGFRLRPRLVTRMRLAMQSMLQGPGLFNSRPAPVFGGQATEKLAVFDFDVLYGELPVVNSSRTVLVSGGRTVAIRDRNPPQYLTKPILPPQPTNANSAWQAAMKNSTDTLAKLYPGASPRLAADPREPNARLVLWPEERTRQLHLAWALTVKSTSRTQPYLRRYWVSAAAPGRILDFEDLIFYDQQPTVPSKPAPSASPFGSFPGFFADGSRPKVKITDWPVPSRAETANVAPGTVSPSLGTASPPRERGEMAATPGSTAVFNGSVSGTVTGTMWQTSPYSSVVSRPLQGVEIIVTRPTGITSVAYSDAAGRYSLSGVSGLATVSATLNGPACRIVNDAKSDDPATFNSRVGQGTVDIDFPAGSGEEYKLAQNDAFYSVNRAYDFVRSYLPDQPTKVTHITTHVNVDSSCNAYYDRSDNTLNFFRSSTTTSEEKGCPNTGYRDVVYHEYGHAVDDELGGILDGAYSEGFGDGLSILITHSPLVGTDFYGPGKNLRDARKVFLWPKVKDSEIHEAGQAYAGFCWELTQQLQRTYGQDRAFEVAKQLILGAAVQNPKDIPDAVRLSFFMDAKLYPGGRAGGTSLHAPQLRAAAQSRQLPIPSDSSNLSSPVN